MGVARSACGFELSMIGSSWEMTVNSVCELSHPLVVLIAEDCERCELPLDSSNSDRSIEGVVERVLRGLLDGNNMADFDCGVDCLGDCFGDVGTISSSMISTTLPSGATTS